MEKVIKLVDKINSGGKWALAIMFAVMSIIVFLQVIFRFLLKSPLPWSEELARYLMIWITFLGAGVITRSKGLIMVEAIVKALPLILQKIISYILLVITIAFTLIVFYYGVKMIGVTSHQSASTLPIPMAW